MNARCLMLVALISLHNPTNAEVIRWATSIDFDFNVINPTQCLGAPDGDVANFFNGVGGGTTSGARLDAFNQYHHPLSVDLAQFLGIPPETISDADYLAFDANGTSGRRFESSTWTFSDGTATRTVVYDFYAPNAAPEVIAGGNVSRQEMASFFGYEDAAPTPPGDFAYILFDIDSIVDVESSDFSVLVTAAGGPSETDPNAPDIDAMGLVIHYVPPRDQLIRWATSLDSHSNVDNPFYALGTPDGRLSNLFNGTGTAVESSIRFDMLDDPLPVYSGALLYLLGVSEVILSQTDFLAFDVNGSPGRRFESSSWSFLDGSASHTVNYDFNDPTGAPEIIGSGNISHVNMEHFFGYESPVPGASGDFSFILFDIDSWIDVRSPSFSVTVSAIGGPANTDPNSPDIDALGVLVPYVPTSVNDWNLYE